MINNNNNSKLKSSPRGNFPQITRCNILKIKKEKEILIPWFFIAH